MKRTERPAPTEHADYYAKYIRHVPDGDILVTLRAGLEATAEIVSGRPAWFADRRLGPGKWTVRDILLHVIDTERTFGFRAFWFSRGGGELPSMEQDDFAARAGASARTIESLLAEWRAVREANLALFESLDEEASMRTGVASGYRFTPRALAWISAGHEIHHRRQFTELAESHARA